MFPQPYYFVPAAPNYAFDFAWDCAQRRTKLQHPHKSSPWQAQLRQAPALREIELLSYFLARYQRDIVMGLGEFLGLHRQPSSMTLWHFSVLFLILSSGVAQHPQSGKTNLTIFFEADNGTSMDRLTEYLDQEVSLPPQFCSFARGVSTY